ncbi:hypothetical protein [Crenobacter cavernae]|uniref:PIN domain-containing protein n=1 Tax=Crenobacter cavernae TaxID=2290923 RepID=A0A345Y3L2_9NEIS|nr:hypothetical protein [Crenobacter cavernae]AXK38514.1 hypothetical protein DWG20_03225 [Crenobacter cavernae]
MKKAYLDNVLVCAIYSDDQKGESAALVKILEAYDQHRLELVTSQVTKEEIDKCPEEWKKKHNQTYDRLNKVKYVEAHELKGYNIQDNQFGFLASPRMDDHPTFTRLQQIGLDENDAKHVMQAIESNCDVFLTCDKITILKYRSEIETEFPSIKLMLPSELVPILT